MFERSHYTGDRLDRFLFFHLTRLLFDGSWSYVERIKKLNLSGAICQISFQVIDLCSASSQLVHWPCLDCCTLFMSFLLSSSFLTSLMTLLWQSLPLACDHHFFSFTPKPCHPVWVRPITSLKARFSLALIIVSLTFHFLPVFNIGFKDFITLSLESSSIIWSLTLPDLNSSIIDFSGNFSFACPQ